MGLDEWLVKVSWLGELASVFWWVELYLFCLECSEVSSSEFCVSVGLLWLWAACLLAAQNQHGMSCSGTCWLLGGCWFQCRYGGFWMSSCLLMFPGVPRSSLMFQVLELSLLLLRSLYSFLQLVEMDRNSGWRQQLMSVHQAASSPCPWEFVLYEDFRVFWEKQGRMEQGKETTLGHWCYYSPALLFPSLHSTNIFFSSLHS